MYDVDSGFPEFRDVHADNLRSSVVVRVNTILGRLNLLTRTTDLSVEGVDHPPVPEWGLHKPGKFGRKPIQTLDVRQFKAPLVDLLGELDDETWAKVREMWETA